MDVNELAKALQAETGADRLTVWKWLAGGFVQKPIAMCLTGARERIESARRESEQERSHGAA